MYYAALKLFEAELASNNILSILAQGGTFADLFGVFSTCLDRARLNESTSMITSIASATVARSGTRKISNAFAESRFAELLEQAVRLNQSEGGDGSRRPAPEDAISVCLFLPFFALLFLFTFFVF